MRCVNTKNQNAGNSLQKKKSIMVHIKLYGILSQTFVDTQIDVNQQNMSYLIFH